MKYSILKYLRPVKKLKKYEDAIHKKFKKCRKKNMFRITGGTVGTSGETECYENDIFSGKLPDLKTIINK